MSIRTFPQPETMRRGVAGTCKWCGRDGVKKPSLYWHPECAGEYRAHTDPAHQLGFLLERDGPFCRACGAGGYRNLGEHVPRPAGASWEEWYRMLADPEAPGRYCILGAAIPFQVDHVRPLWSVAHLADEERRPFFGPTNLQLLCGKCHAAKTAREAAERAAHRRNVK